MKGISPFIAVILTIAATVVISGLIVGWGTTLFKGTAGTVEQKASNFTIQCAVGMLDVEKIYCTSDSNGLVGYWKLDSVNTSNYTLDVSGYGNNGRLINYPCNPATCNLTDGKHSSALQFDGVNDYVRVPDSSSLDITDEITMEVWIYPKSVTNLACLLDKSYSYAILLWPNNILVGLFGAGGTWNTGYIISENKWYHIVVTYDGEYKKLYSNGTLVKNATQTGKIDVWDYDFLIGSEYYLGYIFNGTIDEVRIYNRALSAGEIQRHYQHGVAVRALLANIGQTNLGKNFTLSWTVNNSFNSSLVNLTSDLTPGSTQWLNKYNITEAGNLENVRIISYLCPNVARSKDITGMIC